MNGVNTQQSRRKAFMVLSPRSLSYARLALQSLLANALEPLHLQLITDSAADADELRQVLAELASNSDQEPRHVCSVSAEAELDDAEADLFQGLPHLRAFRKGHPCWRKVTDPLLLSAPGEEMILLDPDLYFPNQFTFESTPASGLLLMWQQPNCLLPPEVVRRAMQAQISLARHVDIGVSHWRAGTDLAWLDWMLGQLADNGVLPRMMHVEAIVWAAIAMREGGGYLDPRLWVCWHRTQATRIRRKLGAAPAAILAGEPWSRMKCFHAGGEAKWWLPDFAASRADQQPRSITNAGVVNPFVRLTPSRYGCEQGAKAALRGVGYYRLFGAKQG